MSRGVYTHIYVGVLLSVLRRSASGGCAKDLLRFYELQYDVTGCTCGSTEHIRSTWHRTLYGHRAHDRTGRREFLHPPPPARPEPNLATISQRTTHPYIYQPLAAYRVTVGLIAHATDRLPRRGRVPLVSRSDPAKRPPSFAPFSRSIALYPSSPRRQERCCAPFRCHRPYRVLAAKHRRRTLPQRRCPRERAALGC